MVFDELEVGMDISTRGFTSGIDRAEDETSALNRTTAQLSAAGNRAASGLDELAGEATQTAATSSLAASRVDALGDQLAQTARRAGAAAAGVASYSTAASGAAGASASWSAVMSASLVPALASLSLTLGPLVATLGAVATGAGALATAFGTVVGSGFLAYGRQLASTMPDVEKPTEALAQRFGELRSEIADIIAPLGRQFVPLIRDGLNALPQLVRSIVNTLGPLDQFAQALRSLGQSAMDIIPQITAAFFDLARRALPVFQDFVSFVGTRGPAAFDMLVDSFQATRDEFAQLLGATIRALPPLLELGNTVTQVLVPALAGAISAVGRAVDRFNDLPQPIRDGAVAAGLLGSAFVVAVPAVTAIAGAISALLGPLGAAVVGISTLAGAWVADIGNMRAQTTRVFGVIQDEITATMQTLDAVTGGALSRLGDTVRGFVTTARTNLDSLVRFIADTFIAGIRALGDTVRGTLLQLSTLWATHGKRVITTVRETYTVARDTIQVALARIREITTGAITTIDEVWARHGNTVIETVRTTYTTVRDTIATVLATVRSVVGPRLQTVEGLWTAHKGTVLETVRTGYTTARDVIDTALSRIREIIGPRLRTVGAFWKTHKATVVEAVRTAYRTVRQTVETAIGRVREFVGPQLETINNIWNDHKELVKGVVRDAYEFVSSHPKKVLAFLASRVIPGPLGLIVTLFEDHFGKIKTVVRTTLETLRSVIKTGLQELKSFWDEHGNRIVRTVRQSYTTVREIINNTIAETRTTTQSSLSSINQLWVRHGDQVTSTVQQLTQSLMDVLRPALKFIETEIIQPTLGRIERLWDAHGKFLTTFVQELYQDIRRFTKLSLTAIQEFIATTLDGMRKLWEMHGNEITAIVEFSFDAIGGLIEAALDAILTNLRVFLALMQGDWEKAFNAARGFIERTFNGIQSFLDEWGSRFLNFMSATLDDFYQYWVDLANDLIFGSLIPEMFQAILDTTRTKMEETLTVLQTILGDAMALFRNVFDRILGIVVDKLTTLKSRATGQMDALWNAISGVLDQILNGFSSTFDAASSFADDIISEAENAASRAKSAFNDAQDWVSDAWDEVSSAPDSSDADSGGGGGGGGGGGDDDDGGSSSGGGSDPTPEPTGDQDQAFDGSDSDGSTGGNTGPVNETEGGGTIPGFAEGGYVTGPTAAMVGEGSDDEFVTPRSTMLRELRDVAEQAMGNGGGDTYHFDIDVDGTDMDEQTLIRAVKQQLTRELHLERTR